MTVFEEKLINKRRLYAKVGCSREMGDKRLEKLREAGEIDPEVTPSHREFLSAFEAEKLAKAIYGE